MIIFGLLLLFFLASHDGLLVDLLRTRIGREWCTGEKPARLPMGWDNVLLLAVLVRRRLT